MEGKGSHKLLLYYRLSLEKDLEVYPKDFKGRGRGEREILNSVWFLAGQVVYLIQQGYYRYSLRCTFAICYLPARFCPHFFLLG